MEAPLNYEIIRIFKGIFEELEIKGYLVGGAVRDLLLGRMPLDFDFTVELNEEEHLKCSKEIARILDCSYNYNSHYHTAKFQYKENDIDFVMARGESYPEIASRPIVFSSGIYDDILRRDFSVNSLAMKMWEDFGRIVDYVGGINDIKEGTIRVLHEKSFRDDPTRLFRGIKYASRFNFHIEDNTFCLMKDCLQKGYLKYLSPQRISQELYRILEDSNARESLVILNNLGAFDYISNAKIKINLCYNENIFNSLPNKKKMVAIFYENELESLMRLKDALQLGDDLNDDIFKIKLLKAKRLERDEELYKFLFLKQNTLDFDILLTLFGHDIRIENFIKYKGKIRTPVEEIRDIKDEDKVNFIIDWKVKKLINILGGK